MSDKYLIQKFREFIKEINIHDSNDEDYIISNIYIKHGRIFIDIEEKDNSREEYDIEKFEEYLVSNNDLNLAERYYPHSFLNEKGEIILYD